MTPNEARILLDMLEPVHLNTCSPAELRALAALKETATEVPSGRCRIKVLNGNKIRCIKLYRALTDAGLKEAKDAVEADRLLASTWITLPRTQSVAFALSKLWNSALVVH